MGGDDDPGNLVHLTAEEHYVAHQLLVKMHPDDFRLLWALSAMTHRTKRMGRPPNKRYGWLRRKFAEAMRERHKGKPLSEEHRAKLSAAAKRRKRRPHSEEAKAKMSAAAKGRKKSPEHVAAMSAAKTGIKRGPHTEDTKRKIAESNRISSQAVDRSYMASHEYRSSQSAKMKKVWASRKLDKLGGHAS